MPRPYGWTSGEGRYKGLGQIYYGLGQMGPPFVCSDGTQVQYSAQCPGGGPPSTLTTEDQLSLEIDALWNYIGASAGAGQGQPPQAIPISEWVKKNMGLLLVGGIVGLLVFRR